MKQKLKTNESCNNYTHSIGNNLVHDWEPIATEIIQLFIG